MWGILVMQLDSLSQRINGGRIQQKAKQFIKIFVMYRKIFILFFIGVFLVAGRITSQTVPNAGFESWHNVGGWYDNPDDWNTNNNSILAQSVLRDSNAYKGVLAMKVANLVNLTGHAYIMFPLNKHPYSINVYVRSNISASDSAVIYVRAYFSGNKVDSGAWYSSVSVKNWTAVNIPLYNKSLAIDSLAIDVKAGNKSGTWISVDEFSIDLGAGIKEEDTGLNWSLFPNPINENSFLFFESKGYKSLTFMLYDELGRVVQTISGITSPRVKIDKADLRSGLYTFIVSSEDEGLIRGKLIIAK